MAKQKPKRQPGANGFKIASFRLPNQTAHLTFEGTQWEGAEVVVRLGMTINMYLEITRLVSNNNPIELTQVFGNAMLVAWNLVDEDGTPIPATGDGMNGLPDIALALRIVHLWLEAVAGVSAPLEPQLNGGNTLVAASTALDNP